MKCFSLWMNSLALSAAPLNCDVHCDERIEKQWVQCARTRRWQTTCGNTASSSTVVVQIMSGQAVKMFPVRGAAEQIWITTATVRIAVAGSTAKNVGRNGIMSPVRGATEQIWITCATVGIALTGSTAMNVGRNRLRRRRCRRRRRAALSWVDGPGGARTNDWIRVWLMMFETGMNHFVVSYFVK